MTERYNVSATGLRWRVNRPAGPLTYMSSRLTHLRRVTNTTEKELSEFLGMATPSYAKYERERTSLLPTHRVMRLPDFPAYRGLSLNWLLRGEGDNGLSFDD